MDEVTALHSVCETWEGFVLTGGIKSNRCVEFIASTKTWLEKKPMRSARHSHGSICFNGILYVICGSEEDPDDETYGKDDDKSDTMHCLTLQDDGSWEELPESPIAAHHVRIAVIHGQLFMLATEYTTTQLFSYNIRNEEWSTLVPCPGGAYKRANMLAVNHELLVVGGEKRICMWYSPSTNAWCEGKQPIKQHLFGAMVRNSSTTVMLLGGNFARRGTDEVWEVDITEGSWSMKSFKMPDSLICHTALMLVMPE